MVVPEQILPDGKRLKFGVFEADLDAGELTKFGKRLALQDQPFRLLAMLLKRPGEVITREELRASLWPEAVVDFDHGVNKAISKIRDVLGDSAENPRFIQTVARRGYRFLGEVTNADTPRAEIGALGPPAHGPPEPPGAAPSEARRRRISAWLLVAVPVAFLLVFLLIRFVLSSGSSRPPIRSLAVLPLENLSGDPSQEYFADGMTDELITSLAQISALRVISRSSMMTYKHTRKPLAEIARELDVQAVVEGSVLRSGDQVRITAQLIRVPVDEHIWAHSYEGDLRDTLVVQSHVAQAVAEQIRVSLSRTEAVALQGSKPIDVAAYDDYLQGRYYLSQRTGASLRQAIEYLKRSIAIDPGNAEAYSALADTYALSGDWEYGIMTPAEAFPLAKAAALEALALDDKLAAAHASMALVLDLYYWDWDAAEKQYVAAINLNPGYATAHHWYAWHLFVLGRNSEAMFEMRKSESLDPFSLIIRSDLAEALYVLHQFQDSVQQSKKTLALEPNFAVGHYELGENLAQLHQYDAAIGEFKTAIDLTGHLTAFDANLAYTYALAGQKEAAVKIARQIETRPDLNPSANANIALIYVGLGDLNKAMYWLNQAYDARFNPSVLIRPGFDPLRSDSRFVELQRRMGLRR